jgi:hypothetical protein
MTSRGALEGILSAFETAKRVDFFPKTSLRRGRTLTDVTSLRELAVRLMLVDEHERAGECVQAIRRHVAAASEHERALHPFGSSRGFEPEFRQKFQARGLEQPESVAAQLTQYQLRVYSTFVQWFEQGTFPIAEATQAARLRERIAMGRAPLLPDDDGLLTEFIRLELRCGRWDEASAVCCASWPVVPDRQELGGWEYRVAVSMTTNAAGERQQTLDELASWTAGFRGVATRFGEDVARRLEWAQIRRLLNGESTDLNDVRKDLVSLA